MIVSAASIKLGRGLCLQSISLWPVENDDVQQVFISFVPGFVPPACRRCRAPGKGGDRKVVLAWDQRLEVKLLRSSIYVSICTLYGSPLFIQGKGLLSCQHSANLAGSCCFRLPKPILGATRVTGAPPWPASMR